MELQAILNILPNAITFAGVGLIFANINPPISLTKLLATFIGLIASYYYLVYKVIIPEASLPSPKFF